MHSPRSAFVISSTTAERQGASSRELCKIGRSGPQREHGGFTLIELLLVLTITGLLLAMTPSLMQKAFPVLKLKAAARDLVQEIRYVQNAAIINGQVAEIVFDLERGEYRSDQVNAGAVTTLPSGLVLSRKDEPLQSLSGEQIARLIFYPDGSANGGELLLANDRSQMAIRVDWLTSKIHLDELQATETL
jgi:general secretion pathway protein H